MSLYASRHQHVQSDLLTAVSAIVPLALTVTCTAQLAVDSNNTPRGRWEFDRNKLFSRTRYMALRCTDLLFVAEMLRDMRAMLGPELKAVTGDAKGIDEVMSRVEALVVPLETAPFDLFDRRYQTSWEVRNMACLNLPSLLARRTRMPKLLLSAKA